MDNIRNIAASHGPKILEYCANRHGASFRGKKADSMSDIGAFSFYPTKVLGSFGDSGMGITNDVNLYEKRQDYITVAQRRHFGKPTLPMAYL